MKNNMNAPVILYDQDCPMCAWYTGAFEKMGYLPNNGRVPISRLQEPAYKLLNANKSRNEIPLIDLETGRTWYGIDALLEVLGRKHAWIKIIGTVKPVYYILSKLYILISANRKVIVAKTPAAKGFDCTPDMHVKYRLLFLFFGWFFCNNACGKHTPGSYYRF